MSGRPGQDHWSVVDIGFKLSSIGVITGATRSYVWAELTGRVAPAAGGPTTAALTPVQKGQDRAARVLISRELGHEREQITAVYLGR